MHRAMLSLERTVRLSINPRDGSAPARPDEATNGFAGVPAMRGLGGHHELRIRCRGEPDPVTGYLIDIKRIDDAARQCAAARLLAVVGSRPDDEPARELARITQALAERIGPRFDAVKWSLSPYYSLEMSAADPTRVTLRQQFEFAAAHRLHSPALSDEDNRRIFGKCNNPSGHGHNYRLEPAVVLPVADSAAFTLTALERVVKAVILDRFDHKHLNIDTVEFSADRGVIPTVENIARVCYDLLRPAIARESHGQAELRAVTVWETDRTSSTYPA